jgi:hypothetical protein
MPIQKKEMVDPQFLIDRSIKKNFFACIFESIFKNIYYIFFESILKNAYIFF